MKKNLMLMLLALLLAIVPMMGVAEEAFNPEGFIDWYNESYRWMSVENGHWSSDPADKPTHEDLEKIFSMTMKQQTAGHRTPYFFIVVEDVEEQRKVMGDMGFGADPATLATEGTVTILAMCDNLLTMEEGHYTPYDNNLYNETYVARYDTGLACGALQVAAATLGYYTHYIGLAYGENAPKDLGTWQSLSHYVQDDYMRAVGLDYAYGDEPNPESMYPVSGNCIFICAIVMGKPAEGETVETWGSNHGRPDNWVIWNGVPNEKPSPAVAAREERAAAKAAGTVVDTATSATADTTSSATQEASK